MKIETIDNMEKFEKLDNDQKELVKYWIEKYQKEKSFAFIEKHLTPEPVIEVGKWYKSDRGHLWFVEDIVPGNEPFIYRSYGFASNGVWCDSDMRSMSDISRYKEATPEEVGPRLIEFAKSKGYKNGNYKCACSPNLQTENVSEYIYYDSNMRSIIHGTKTKGNFLMHNGKWAEIIDDKSEIRESVARLEAELQELKSKL